MFPIKKSRNGRRKNNNGGKAGSIGRGGTGFSYQNANHGEVVKQLPLFPIRTRKRLPYHDDINFTGTASASAAYIFSANGIFDPDITGTGHQPMGFDQMMLYYNHYTVIRSRVVVNCVNTTVTNPIYVGIHLQGATTQITDPRILLEEGQVVYCSLSQIGVNGSQAVLRSSVDCGAFQGVDDVLDDPNMRGDAASNPTEQLYYALYCWNPFNATVPTASFSVRLEYDVMFHEPRTGSLSITYPVKVPSDYYPATAVVEQKTLVRRVGR